jgi:hypothetical protein
MTLSASGVRYERLISSWVMFGDLDKKAAN